MPSFMEQMLERGDNMSIDDWIFLVIVLFFLLIFILIFIYPTYENVPCLSDIISNISPYVQNNYIC